MTEFVTTIPSGVLQKLLSQEHADFWAGGDSKLCRRLATHIDMTKVWSSVLEIENSLERDNVDGLPTHDGDLFSYEFLFCASSLRKRWGRLVKTPTKEIERHLDEIIAASARLNKLIERYSDELHVLDARLPENLPKSRQDLTSGRPLDLILRPTKPNAETAEVTFCVRALVHFFLTKTTSHHFDLVALTVTTIMDREDPLTRDHVTKLASDLR